MSLRSISVKSASIKSTILALGVSLLTLAPAVLHASSYTYDFSLNPTSCVPIAPATTCTEVGGTASVTFNTQPTLTYTDYHLDVTSLTFMMNDGADFVYPGSGSTLGDFEFSQLTPTGTIRNIQFAESIDGNTLTLDTTGTYVLYTPTADTYGSFGTVTLGSLVTSTTPEPSSLLLLGTGLLGGAGTLLRRYKLQRA